MSWLKPPPRSYTITFRCECGMEMRTETGVRLRGMAPAPLPECPDCKPKESEAK